MLRRCFVVMRLARAQVTLAGQVLERAFPTSPDTDPKQWFSEDDLWLVRDAALAIPQYADRGAALEKALGIETARAEQLELLEPIQVTQGQDLTRAWQQLASIREADGEMSRRPARHAERHTQGKELERPVAMRAKRSGPCEICPQPIATGDKIIWGGGNLAWHTACAPEEIRAKAVQAKHKSPTGEPEKGRPVAALTPVATAVGQMKFADLLATAVKMATVQGDSANRRATLDEQRRTLLEEVHPERRKA